MGISIIGIAMWEETVGLDSSSDCHSRKKNDIFAILHNCQGLWVDMRNQLLNIKHFLCFHHLAKDISQYESQLKPHLLSIASQCLSPCSIISDCNGCRMDCKMRVVEEGGSMGWQRGIWKIPRFIVFSQIVLPLLTR